SPQTSLCMQRDFHCLDLALRWPKRLTSLAERSKISHGASGWMVVCGRSNPFFSRRARRTRFQMIGADDGRERFLRWFTRLRGKRWREMSSRKAWGQVQLSKDDD